MGRLIAGIGSVRPPVDREEMRHRRVLMVVVGQEVRLRQPGAHEPVDLAAVYGDGEGLGVVVALAAAAGDDDLAAGRDQFRDGGKRPDAVVAGQDLDGVALVDKVEAAAPRGRVLKRSATTYSTGLPG